MNSTRFFIFSAVIFLASGSCRNHHNYYSLTLQVKEHVFFRVNSQWVYQNDSSLVTDTVVVTQASKTQPCHQIDTWEDCYETFTLTCHSSYRGLSFTDRTLSNTTSGMNTDVVRDPQEFEIPTSSDFPIYTDDSQYSPKITVNGFTYYNILIMHIDNNLRETPDYRAATYYWAKNVGNIKKVFQEGNQVTSWSLINKQVYQ